LQTEKPLLRGSSTARKMMSGLSFDAWARPWFASSTTETSHPSRTKPVRSSSAKAASLSKIRIFLAISDGLTKILGHAEQGQTNRSDLLRGRPARVSRRFLGVAGLRRALDQLFDYRAQRHPAEPEPHQQVIEHVGRLARH